jgi:hypothetical protein
MLGAGYEESDEWGVTQNLAAPPPLPGMTQHWVRVMLLDKEDTSNYSKHLQRDWLPRPADTVNDEWAPMKISQGKFAGMIQTHDMILMHIPEARLAARTRANMRKTQSLVDSVNNDIMKIEKMGAPVHQRRRTEVTGGNGRIPQPRQDDDDI